MNSFTQSRTKGAKGPVESSLNAYRHNLPAAPPAAAADRGLLLLCSLCTRLLSRGILCRSSWCCTLQLATPTGGGWRAASAAVGGDMPGRVAAATAEPPAAADTSASCKSLEAMLLLLPPLPPLGLSHARTCQSAALHRVGVGCCMRCQWVCSLCRAWSSGTRL